MRINIKPYDRKQDYDRIGDLLVLTYGQSEYINWFQPIWEYMHFHPYIDDSLLPRCAVWRDGLDVVGVAHIEHSMGEVFFQIAPGYSHLKEEMVVHAETNLFRQVGGKRTVGFYIDEEDSELESVAQAHGFNLSKEVRRDMTSMAIPDPFPETPLAEGFTLSDLAHDDDLCKLHRVLHRGFNHPGEPPPEGLKSQAMMQSAPDYRKDLNVVIKAPDGSFVSYCGMWYEAQNKFAYVEPVATDPRYRRLGLGRAAVLEGIRRCGKLGATVAYVGSTQPFYFSLGFDLSQKSAMWFKEWN